MYEIRYAEGSVWWEIAEEMARQALHEHPMANDPRSIPAVNTLTGQQGSYAGDVVFVRWLS